MKLAKPATVMLCAVLWMLAFAPACTKDDAATVRDLNAVDDGAGGGGGRAPRCEPVGQASTAAIGVEVKLSEWSVAPIPTWASAGTIHFHVTNAGKVAHELLVLRTPDPATLPTRADGSIDESRLGKGVFPRELAPFPAGSSCDATFALPPGSYVLVCNLVDRLPPGESESHFQEGMHAAFTVH